MRLIDEDKIQYGEIELKFDSGTITLEGPYAEKEQIDKLPTINPESLRPVGHWKPVTADELFGSGCYAIAEYACSLCGEEVDADRIEPELLYKFCPYCGAKMI